MKKQILAAMVAMLVFSTLSLHAQTGSTAASSSTATTKKARAKKETAEQKAIRELEEKIAAQQEQINALMQQNSVKDAALSTVQSTASTAQTQAADAQSQAQSAAVAAQAAAATAQSQAADVTTLKSSVTDLQNNNATLIENISSTKADLNDKIDSPSAIHYKGVTITPVAFFAAEGVWRQHSVNSDVNTPFNSIPLPSASEGHVSEMNFSARQSRLGALFEGNAGKFKLTGYFEGDFLSSGTTSNNNQSNSYTFRQRQFWGKAELSSGLTVTGGQTWSLVTENRRSTDTRAEIQPNTIDAQYLVGYSWERQPGFRIQQRWGDVKKQAFTAALSVEQAQITGFTANGTNPNQYFFGGIGQSGGLYNAAAGNGGASNITAYANNVAPDVIVKGAFDAPLVHIEVGGVARFMRDYYYPVTWGGTASAPTFSYGNTYSSHTAAAGGLFGSARVYVGKVAELAVQGMAGTGTGRYGSSQLADVTLRPDQTLEPIRNYHGLLSIETHPTPKLDVFAYYGGEYAQRTVYASPVGNLIGYGPRNLNDSGCYNLPAAPTTTVGNTGFTGSISAPNCGSPTRYIQEAMGGFIYRVASSPKYGKLQYWVTYSYFQRNLWSGNNVPSSGPITGPTGPRATEPMLDVSMRYYIP